MKEWANAIEAADKLNAFVARKYLLSESLLNFLDLKMVFLRLLVLIKKNVTGE